MSECNPKPHVLLFTDCQETARRESSTGLDAEEHGEGVDGNGESGRWHFAIESLDGEVCADESEWEPGVSGERLELLAVVRGLESLDQPTRVTLVTPSRYVHRGVRFGLDEWRACDWKWERHGWMVPIKNADLWQRVDAAMQIHTLQCRQWRIDQAHGVVGPKRVQITARASAEKPARSADVASPTSAARTIIRAVRDGVAAARQAAHDHSDKPAARWSLAQ